MAESIPVLWSDSIKVDVVTPLAILRAQIDPLRQRTKGLLRAEVRTITADDPEVVHVMELVAPTLNNYRHQVLSVHHEKNLVYPAQFRADCFEPVDDDYAPENEGGWPSADSEEEFIELLRKALGSKSVNAVISSLLARMNEATDLVGPKSSGAKNSD
jgi:hypothetical protein